MVPTKPLSAPQHKEPARTWPSAAATEPRVCNGGHGTSSGKYFIADGPLQNWEPVVMYEQFDPDTKMSNDLYTRAIVGFDHYFENLPPKIQSKISINL